MKSEISLIDILVCLACSDVAQLGIFSYFIRRPSTDGISVNINIRLLSDIEPDDLPCLGVDGPCDLLQAGLHPGSSGLATAVDLNMMELSWGSGASGDQSVTL